MPKLQLESAKYGNLDLSSIFDTGVGVEALSGATGLGLPSVSTQWLVGAGDGATYRGRRVQTRVIDLPIYLSEVTRDRFKGLWNKLALMLSGPCTLRFVEDNGTSWYTVVHRTGGGGYTYGDDTTGEGDLLTVLTLEAGDPYWTFSQTSTKRIVASTSGGLLGGTSLSALMLSPSQAIGSMDLHNPGTADAYPAWLVEGPGINFRSEAVLPDGRAASFEWGGALLSGESLIIDTRTGAVVDGTGANRYSDMASAPKLWAIPPGSTVATVTLEGTDLNSTITCEWRPRSWAVI